MLEEKGIALGDGVSKSMRRGFEAFLTTIDSNKDLLKNDKQYIVFTDKEKPLIKRILCQIYDKKGIIVDYIDQHKANEQVSSQEIRKFIQSIIDEADKEGFEEFELEQICGFFAMALSYPQKFIIEQCHDWIDCLAVNLEELPYTLQVAYLGDLDLMLKKEVALRLAESTINIGFLAEIFDENEDEQTYSGHELEVRYEYMQRDKAVLEKIQEDDDLRQYIEKKFGKKAEEIFSYAALNNN